MEVGMFYAPVIGPVEALERGMAGQSTDLYQTMLGHLVEQARYLDDHGYYGIAFTEHHLHVEGITVSNNPVMLDQYIGARTQRIRVGQLGLVLPPSNPIRVAEDIAMLDQMTRGRAFAGFARGIQPRWVNILGQHLPGLADNRTDAEAYNAAKIEIYGECIDIIKLAWTQETFSYQGKYWQIPVPGIDWPAAEVTRRIGAGIDADGRVTQVGIAPRPYQKPHPPMFEPFAFSEQSVELAASRGLVPVAIVTDKGLLASQIRAAQRGYAAAGRDLPLGQGMGMAREVVVADTEEEAWALGRKAAWEWTEFFARFGFNAVLAHPGEDYTQIPNTWESQVERGFACCGTPDTVSRQLEAMLAGTEVEYLWLFTHAELIPQPALMRHFELLTERVLPRFTDRVR